MSTPRTAWLPAPVHPFPEDGSGVLIEICNIFFETVSKGGVCTAMVFLEVWHSGPAPGATINQFKICTESTVVLFITSTDVNHNKTDV